MVGGRMFRCRHEEVSATEAINPLRECSGWGGKQNPVKVIFLYGSWNRRCCSIVQECEGLHYAAVPVVEKLRCDLLKEETSMGNNVLYLTVKVDGDDECIDVCTRSVKDGGLEVPPELPCVLLLAHLPTNNGITESIRVEHVDVECHNLEQAFVDTNEDTETEYGKTTSSVAVENLTSSLKKAWSRLFDTKGNILPPQPKQSDKSQVGKSSICMGLLGALLKTGKYAPSDLAYIKPATQCEAVQLVEEFCKHKGITSCVPIGPIVYYKGFTRSFLKGETGETSEDLLQKASEAVDTLAMGKKVVIIDGVGYPAVGSITGTDNASVAKASGRLFPVPGSTTATKMERAPVPILLVGKSGVGDAIDSFNINATYFSHRNVPVLGAIFNKMNLEGFYSLANCKEAIDMYFHKNQPEKQAFGYIPQIPALINARESVAKLSHEDQLKEAINSADLFVETFAKHVNVDAIVDAARKATLSYIQSTTSPQNRELVSGTKRPAEESGLTRTNSQSKHPRLASKSASPGFALSREQIEAMAAASGAAGG
eukprot:scaffold8679_cov154-Skeletonema_menzelii.AAC.6